MGAQADPDTVTPALPRARVNILAVGSPTTTRYVALLAALLSAGLFAGSWVYNQTQGRDWIKVVVDCAGQALQSTLREKTPVPPVQAEAAVATLQSTCRGAAERGRAVYALGGAGVAGAGGLIVVYLAPVLVRRRRRLRTLGTPLQPASDRFAALAAEAGLRRAPRVERGPARQRDAFSYGPPGRPRVVLPPAAAVRWRDPGLFDPLVLHELAHVRHGDVALAWLARSVGYALAPLLALPVVVALLSGDRSLLGDFLWRAALLALAAALISAALLRSREHDADLRAAQITGDASPVIALLRQVPPQARPARLQQLLARHPAPSQRILALQQPERVTGLTFLDCFITAFLAALLFPLAVNVLVVLFTGAGRTDLGELAAALLAGPLLGGSVGLGLWRAALLSRTTGAAPRVAPAAAGVAAGLVAGQLTSLGGTGSGGLHNAGWLAVSAALGFGATALCAAMGQLYADAIPRLRRRAALTAAAVVVNGLIFATALWIGTTLQFLLDNAGAAFGRQWLVTVLPSTSLVRVTVAALALSAAWALWPRKAQLRAPAWLIEPGGPPIWPAGGLRARHWAAAALASGIAAEGCLAVFHFIAGPPVSLSVQAQRYYLYLWVAAAAGAACTVVLCRLDRARGPGVACLAAPLATLTAATGFLAVNTALGGHLTEQFVVNVTTAPAALGLLFSLTAAPAGLIPPAHRPHGRRAHQLLTACLVPALSMIAITAVLITGRDTVAGPAATLTPANTPASSAIPAATADGLRYLDTTAPAIVAAYSPVKQSIAAAAAATTQHAAVQLIRADVLPRLHAILHQAESVRPGTAQLASIHSACIAALRAAISGYSLLAQGIQDNNASVLAQGTRILHTATAAWTQWQTGLLELTLGDGIPLTSADFGLINS